MDRNTTQASKLFSKTKWRRILSLRLGLGLSLGLLMLATSGCCTPFGPGCDAGHCYDCDGTAGRPIPLGPLQALKQQLTCGGGGCGEVYKGEWISTPPDCVDPCCDDQFVGGAVPSQPYCWTLGSLFDPARFSGRFEGGRACGCCEGCGEVCESCGDAGYVEEGYIGQGSMEGSVIEGSVIEAPQARHSGGCSTCGTRAALDGMTRVRRAPSSQPKTRYAQAPTAASNAQGRVSGQARLATNEPRSMVRPQELMNRPAPRVARIPTDSQRSVEPQDGSPVRQASATVRQQVPARMNYAPRTGASRNRVIE